MLARATQITLDPAEQYTFKFYWAAGSSYVQNLCRLHIGWLNHDPIEYELTTAATPYQYQVATLSITGLDAIDGISIATECFVEDQVDFFFDDLTITKDSDCTASDQNEGDGDQEDDGVPFIPGGDPNEGEVHEDENPYAPYCGPNLFDGPDTA